jgi:hypothetical protein
MKKKAITHDHAKEPALVETMRLHVMTKKDKGQTLARSML